MIYVASPKHYDPKKVGENPYGDEIWQYTDTSWEGKMEPPIFTQLQNISLTITLEDLESYFRKEFEVPWDTTFTLKEFCETSRFFTVLTKLLGV